MCDCCGKGHTHIHDIDHVHDHEHSHDHGHSHSHDHEHGHHHNHGPVITVIEANPRPAAKSSND